MIRRVAIAGIVAAGLLAPRLAAAPASAGSDLGCAGNDCSILLSKLITLNGDVGAGAGFVPLSLPPPPCLWEPIGNAVSGSNYVLQQFPNPAPDTPFGVLASVRQAKKLLTTRPVPPGTWYMLPINPAAGPAGEQACLQLPLFFFAVPGQALPTVPIPPRTLAEFAYNHMLIPRPTLTLNPAAGPTAAGFQRRREGDRAGDALFGRLRADRVPLPAGSGAGQRRTGHRAGLRGALAGAHHRRRADRYGPLGHHLGCGQPGRPGEQHAAADPDDRARPTRQRPGGGDPERERRLIRGVRPVADQRPAPTSTGSLASSTPNAARTPSLISLASASRPAVVASPGLTRASVCLDEIRAPAGPGAASAAG